MGDRLTHEEAQDLAEIVRLELARTPLCELRDKLHRFSEKYALAVMTARNLETELRGTKDVSTARRSDEGKDTGL